MTNKVLYSAIGVAGVTAGGIGIAYLDTGTKVAKKENTLETNKGAPERKTQLVTDLLNEKQRVMITEEVDTNWTGNWTKFKEKYNKTNIKGSVWEFSGWESALDGNEVVKAFKDKCTSHSKEQVTGEADNFYIEIRDYCTKPKADA